MRVALLAGQPTCNSQVAGSSPGWAPPLRSGLGQATYICVPLSSSSIIWYRPRVGGRAISLAGKVTVGLVESNGSLPGVYGKVNCGLTAKKPGSAPNRTLVIEYGTTLLHFLRVNTQQVRKPVLLQLQRWWLLVK